MKKEIVDNETDSYTMAQFLNEALKRNGGPVSVASGYFNVEGYAKLRDNLKEAAEIDGFNLRLLFGKEATAKRDASPQLESSVITETSLITELDNLSIDEQSARLVDDLIGFLKQDIIQVKQNKKRFTHAKCYIFDEVVAVGSSNFTRAGLSTNVELNAILYQPSAQDEVRDWFNRRWEEGEDSKQELIQLLEESKFGLPLEPHLMYMKFLYEYYKPRLEELERERGKIVELTNFQQDAVNTALRIIKKYNGVLIADSTGLGKTHIALELLREYAAVKRKKALLIAPSQVINTVWEPKLLEESIKTKNVTIESTGTASFHPEDYLNYDIVVIDESQNYRNQSTNRHTNLMKLLAGGKRKQVVLITATPVNNCLMDLYHQLSLITAGDDTHFADLGIPDLKKHFVSADRKNIAEGIEDIVRILDELMIRRTRQFIKENYEGAEMNGKPVRFPTRQLRKVEYNLTELFGGTVYKQVLDTIDRLHLVPYRTDYYLQDIEEKEQLEAEQRATLQKIGLLKRFESSVEAIRTSIGRLVSFYQYFGKTLDQGKILNSQAFHRVIQEMGGVEVENDEELFQALEKVELEPLTPEYNVRQMKKDLEEDLKLLEPLKHNLDHIHPYTDRKLTALKERLMMDDVFETGGKKAVIFTQFVDTAKYLDRELRDLKGKEIRLLTGSTKPADRERTLREFAPKANPGGYVAKQADLLISTDVLSEGQNLQDANYIVNYDLPWNPMKIVQRVGRVDRLGSDYPVVTAAVFIPEQQLEDILGLLEKLETKIQKVAQTIGVEATILGEKENPKNFNALTRIRKEDQKLFEDLERGAELLPEQTPFNFIQAYLKKAGGKTLEAIPLGRRSGKRSRDATGVVVFYREKKNPEGMHIVFYDYRSKRFEHYNDIAWLFRKVECADDEPLYLPISGEEGFRQFRIVDQKSKEEILKAVNAPFDTRIAQKVKGKSQRELTEAIFTAFNEGKVAKEQAKQIFETLNLENLIAWEDEFASLLDEYKQTENADALLTSLAQLFLKYQISPRAKGRPRALSPEDLEVVGYTFLSGEDLKDLILDA